jgi:hypothetical protein
MTGRIGSQINKNTDFSINSGKMNVYASVSITLHCHAVLLPVMLVYGMNITTTIRRFI